MRRRLALALSAVLAAGLLGACTSSDIDGTESQGYIAGKGIIKSVAVGDRIKPGKVAGETLDGDQVSLADYRGQVVVVNVWGSWCPPCRAEAPMLAAAARDLATQDVAFLGIDSRDPSKAAAQAFVRRQKIPYPSIYDQSGRTLLAFQGTLTPNSIPSTLIIDNQGRVAASVLGQISRTTLYDLVEDAGGKVAS